MKTASPLLHQLIHSLNGTEKKYFLKYLLLRSHTSNLQGSLHYELFTAMSKMKVFDEVKLKKKFKDRITTERCYWIVSALMEQPNQNMPNTAEN
jgi:hypothetical protein